MKIPKQAKKVFSGIIHDVYHYEQKMFDGSHATFESLRRADSAQAIPIQGNKILISKEQQPSKEAFYTLPGGRIEKDEEPLKGAKRELLEETGFTSDDWELFATYEPSSKMDWTVYLYIARDCKKVAEQKLDAGEKVEVQAVSFEKFMDIVASEQFRDREFALDILRMYYRDNSVDAFRKKLFGT